MTKLRTAQWDSNMFQQWITYSAETVFKAQKKERRECIACYNAKRIPQLLPLPGSNIGDCSDLSECFAFCAMHMAGKLDGWSKDSRICPYRLKKHESYDIETAVPPVIRKPDKLIFPFCIARGEELEYVTKRSTPKMTDAAGLVKCSRETWYPTTDTGNTTATIKMCETSPKARIKCGQVVPNGGQVIYEKNSSHIAQYRLLNWAHGTAPLGDIYWMCEHNNTLLTQLPANWTGICAPVMLTGQLTLITPKDNQTHNRPKRNSEGKNSNADWVWKWKHSDEVYISWDQVPYGVPSKHEAIGSRWIQSGRGMGSVPVAGPIANAQFIARNSRWVNYLWYNQQRFINYTILALDLTKEQLHATSVMTLQNRFVIETIMAGDQGVCDEIGDECCTLIPMHTGEEGNLTLTLENMKKMQDEHVRNSNWNTQLKSFWDWLGRMGWGRLFRMIGMVVGGFLLLVVMVVCCVLPLLRILIKRVFDTLTGQYPLLHVQYELNMQTHSQSSIADNEI